MNQDEVKRLFDYKEGGMYWRHDRGPNAKSGNRAGRILKTGYRSIHVSGRHYQEHRLVYLWHHGFIPAQIDHINRIKSDNRIENLRAADHSSNQMNTKDRSSSSGCRGVRFVPKTGRWAARIYRNGKEIRIGTFCSREEARAAYLATAKSMFGDFAT